MPPPGSPRPAPAGLDAFTGWLEGELDRAAARTPNPGRPMLHRLNRSEYANAIRDLLLVEVDPAVLLPPDDSAFGFDNVSDVLGVSPSLQERYLTAASTISALAVGDTRVRPGGETYRIAQDLSQDQHIDGLPLGTLGGTRVRHVFPVDGEYDIQTKLYRTNLNIVRGLQYPHDVEIAIDGRSVHRVTIGGTADLAAMFEKPTDTGDAVEKRMRTKVKVSAGAHDVTVAFVGNQPLEDAVRLQPFLRSSSDNFDWAGHPHIQTVTITGPFGATAVGDTPSRRAIFTCSLRPWLARRLAEARPRRQRAKANVRGRSCTRLARKAYRRPATEAETRPLLAFYEEGRKEGSFDRGIQRGLERILASPFFIFRVEQDPASLAPGSRASPQRLRAGVAPVVLPVEQHPGRDAPGARRAGRPAAADGARRSDRANAGRSEGQRAGGQLCRPVAAASQRPQRAAEQQYVPRLRRQPAAIDAARDGTALREHRPREPQRARPAARGLHLSGRAYGPALRRARHLRQPVQARRGEGRSAPRPPRPRVDPVGDVARRAHVAGAARQVGAREPARADRAAAAR